MLIRELKIGEDPNTVRFEQMLIWAQFTGIPYYLLSKQMVRDPGKKLGEYVSIDNKARGASTTRSCVQGCDCPWLALPSAGSR